jgi:hypothetical protein
MLWIDYFVFNGEEIVFSRLEYLFPVVDKFYICEKKFTSQESFLYIDLMKKKFEPYLSKIVFIVDFSGNDPNFSADKILADCGEEKFILTVCRSDEFPDLSIMNSVKEGLYNKCAEGCIYMEMSVFIYNLNWLLKSTRLGAFVLNDILLREHKNFQKFIDEKGPVFGTFECGWHFSYFFSYNRLLKINKDSEFVGNCLVNGKDLCKREYVKIIQNTMNKSIYPKEILELHKKTIMAQFG